MLATLDNELFVRLKYCVAKSYDEYYQHKLSYPTEVKELLGKRWLKFSDAGGQDNRNIDEQWKIYLGWLLEELCKYESKQNE